MKKRMEDKQSEKSRDTEERSVQVKGYYSCIINLYIYKKYYSLALAMTNLVSLETKYQAQEGHFGFFFFFD